MAKIRARITKRSKPPTKAKGDTTQKERQKRHSSQEGQGKAEPTEAQLRGRAQQPRALKRYHKGGKVERKDGLRYRYGRLLCTAKRKSDGKPCMAYAVKGCRVCRRHGGATKRNQHGLFKRYSVGEVGKIVDAYVGDPQLKDLRQEVGLARAMLRMLMEDTGGSYKEMLQREQTIRRYTETVATLLEKLQRIEEGLKLQLDINQVYELGQRVATVVAEELKALGADEQVTQRVIRRIAKLSVAEREVL